MKKELIKISILFFLLFLPVKFVLADDVITYSFEKPGDMASVIREMRNIASSFAGTFSGNEHGGCIKGFNTEITYSINGNNIIFTIILVGDVDNTIQQKLKHSFSINLPKNIAQALDAVRVGIEKKGGAFYGNEYGGYFRNSGIIGNYIVGEIVTFYIFEKPFIIPISLIEKEIRSYFVGK